jgi:carotenoid 1,2-hydratase
VSDDGEHALTIIALLGSVFSPFYAEAIERGSGDPLAHCSMNVALYGPRRDAWALTERGAKAVSRAPRSLAIGPSSMEWDESGLRVDFDELTAPIPSRIKGTLRIRPLDLARYSAVLDGAGRHIWAPIAPSARVEVALSRPDIRWRGTAYVDSNMGSEPLARAFSSWTWSRACHADRTAVTYDVRRKDGSRLLLAKSFEPGADARDLPELSARSIGLTRWGLPRRIPVDPNTRPRLLRTLEDTPFYARSLASASFAGQPATVVHEALSLERFERGWVRYMIPFRMRRAAP